MLASDDRAAALYRARGTRHGRTLELDQVLLFTIEDGVVQRRARAPERSRRLRVVLGLGSAAMSDARFADGLRYRIEIPSVEGPRVLEAVLDEARARSVPVRRDLAGKRRDDAHRRRDPRDGDARCRRRRRGVALPRAARRLGHGRSVARDGALPGVSLAGRQGSTRASPRCAAGSRSASARSSSRISVCSQTLGRHAARRRAAGDRSSSRRRCCCRARTRRSAACARGARRDDDQRRDRPLGRRARRAARRVLRTARRLRRGARRPGWVRALLRRAGDRPRSPRPST